MTAGSIPGASATGAAAFEVERFEWRAPARLEPAGRWVGGRGPGLGRPTPELQGPGGRPPLARAADARVEARVAAVRDELEGRPARAELEAVERERDEALRARNAAAAERGALLGDRDAALAERDEAVRARDAALAERDA